jgi:rubrerythrin
MQHSGGNDMQNSTDEVIPRFFVVCARIEGVCAELYHYYSELHHDDEDMHQLWKKTALEEENHQKQFELAQRLLHDVDFTLESSLERAEQILHKLNNLQVHVRQTPPDVITALTRSIDIEERLSDLHIENSIGFADQSVKSLFKALGEFDQDHIKSLRHYLAIKTLANSEMRG